MLGGGQDSPKPPSHRCEGEAIGWDVGVLSQQGFHTWALSWDSGGAWGLWVMIPDGTGQRRVVSHSLSPREGSRAV